MASISGFLNGAWDAYKKYSPTAKVVEAFYNPSPSAKAPAGALTGAPQDPNRLQKNADGTAYDPVTGQTYVYQPPVFGANGTSTPGGYTAMATPNVQQQAGTDFNRAGAFFNQVPLYDQREQTAYDREGQLASYLTGITQGTGPSVAGTQLQTGLESAQRAQLAQAAGASGNNGALARLLAMNNTAGLMQETNQQQALARAQEERDALAQLAGVSNAMTQQSQQMAGQKISAADALNSLAMQGEGGHEGLQFQASQDAAKAAQADKDRWANAFTQGVSYFGTGGGAPKK